MADQAGSQNPSRYPDEQSLLKSPTIAAIQQRIMTLESQSHSHQQTQQPDDLTNAVRIGERWLIGISGFTLIAQIIIGIIYWGQLQQMIASNGLTRTALAGSNQSLSETLAEMQEQADAMQRLADNAGIQATQTTNLATQAKNQADRTKELADRASTQISINRASADAAKSAADTAAAGLRPWISIDSDPDIQSITLRGKTGNPLFNFSITLNNFGHAPALLLNDPYFVFGDPMGKPEARRWADLWHDDLCHHYLDQPMPDQERNGIGPRYPGVVYEKKTQVFEISPGTIGYQPDRPSTYNYLNGCIVYSGPSANPIYVVRVIYRVNYAQAFI